MALERYDFMYDSSPAQYGRNKIEMKADLTIRLHLEVENYNNKPPAEEN